MLIPLKSCFTTPNSSDVTLVFGNGKTTLDGPIEQGVAAIPMHQGTNQFRGQVTQAFIENGTDMVLVIACGGNFPTKSADPLFVGQIDANAFHDQEGVGNAEVIDAQVQIKS